MGVIGKEGNCDEIKEVNRIPLSLDQEVMIKPIEVSFCKANICIIIGGLCFS